MSDIENAIKIIRVSGKCHHNDLAIAALEKQIPINTLERKSYGRYAKDYCPVCGAYIDRKTKYCTDCGQALKWD